ncbi:MAG: MlaD family protein [Solirubrobacteraceae bacterium]
MKRVLISGALLAAAAAFVILAGGASKGSAAGTYKIELQNAFGLVTGADFKVAGVPAGTISGINLNTKDLNAVVTVTVNRSGFGQFHADATCNSRPESLIGEYYIDCNPGTSGPVLKAGSTIPVSHTTSTIPADLLQDVMRLPYRQRFSLIVNELGAAAAARSGDLQAALARAVPALTETDNLLNLLGNDSTTLQHLTADSNSVITALANNSAGVKRFIDEANRTARATATQQGNLRSTLARLPGTLEQLRPTLAQLQTTLTTNQPVLANLNQASGQLHRLLTDLPAFSRSARPAIKSLGQASVTGRTAVIAAAPTVADLNTFAKPTPELAGNLAIVLHDLDNPSRAVEPDPRSPGGKGFTGLQALLGYAFNQTLAINTFGPEGHVLAVDAFFSPMCSPYATPAYIAMALKQYGSAYRSCYSWLGPNQPGVNETDPSNPSAAVPDPGGAPPGQTGPKTSAARLTSSMVSSEIAHNATATGGAGPSAGSGSGGSSSTGSGPAINLHQSIGQILGGLGATNDSGSSSSSSSSSSTTTPSAASNAVSSATSAASSAAPSSGSGSSSAPASGSQTQQLLNYLLAP